MFDFGLYFQAKRINDSFNIPVPPYQYIVKNPKVYIVDLKNFYDGSDDAMKGRVPEGLEYEDKTPILLFGDSFTQGQFIAPYETFGFKLSEALHRPVYNRGIPAASLQHMYYQVDDEFADTFFDQVPYSDLIFFTIISPHYKRILMKSNFEILYNDFYLHYTYKDGKFVKDNYDNYFLNLIKSSYLFRFFNIAFVRSYCQNPKNADRLTDIMTAYLTETRRKLEERWCKKSKFVVLFYTTNFMPLPYKEMLREKLEKNGFTVIDTAELTDEDLGAEEYTCFEKWHPNNKAWELLTPKIIEKLNLQ